MKKTITLGAVLLSALSYGQQFSLLSSSESAITMAHELTEVNLQSTMIENVNYKDFTKTHAITSSISGAPALPYFTESVAVPNTGHISLEITHDGFVDYQNVNVAPSKGSIKRNVDPNTVPYSFGSEYATDAFYPGTIAETGEAYILRNTRGITVSISPYQYNPVTKVLRVYRNVQATVLINGEETGINEITQDASVRDVFMDVYQNQYLNANVLMGRYTPLDEEGELLVIAKDSYFDEIQPLVDWKIQKGIKTTVVGTSTAGTTDSAIKSYIQTFYGSHPNLAYVLMIGDHGDVPSHTYGTSSMGEQLWSDTYYAQLSGSDSYPEVFIGRFSGNANEITTQVDRTLEYEKSPAAGDWMTRAIGLGSDEGNGYGDDNEADWQHLRNIRTKLMGYGYTEVHEFYDGNHGGDDASGNPSATIIKPAVNDGVGLFNYTGHGDQNTCITGDFSSTHINQATNNRKYAFVISVACNNGTFTSGTCISETWMRATNAGTPSGAISACGSSILMAWAEPMQTQDEMGEIISESYAHNKKVTLGGIFYNAQMSMLEDYNANLNSREVMQTWVMFGDPSTVFRNKVTDNLTVSHVSNVNLGETSVTVNCNVDDALVAITQDGEILGTGLANGGSVNINFTALTSNQPLIVTATKQNYKPYQGNIVVADGPAGLNTIQSVNDITVYPNPATDVVNINWNGTTPSNVKIMDLSGKVVYTAATNDLNANTTTINTSSLTAGVYILQYVANNNLISTKITLK